MGFRFSLATVLRVRELAEDREEQMLQRIVQEIGQTRTAMAQVRASITRRDERPELCATGREIRAEYAELAELQQRHEELAAQWVKLEELRVLQVQAYAAARRERESLTEMCDSRRSAYEAQAARREQTAVDENFMARRARA